ncbi:MAG: MBL fold metallo-hydrolase [Bacteroidales bacterium]|jgi:glyoxylase-like metal-dependent hydrolase (beta-lactamase superfamily II)|nr:MBL fold metallo-hydrolase [Bacteroidales bacterium]
MKATLTTAFILISSTILGQFNTFLYQTKNNNQIIMLSEGQAQRNADILIDATPEILAETMPDGYYPSATNAFLVRTTTGENVLVDAGFGRELLNNLLQYNVSPEMIDAILITHMHGDHIGGLLDGSSLKTFPNANLYLAKSEYDYFYVDRLETQAQNLANAVISAYRDKLILFEPGEMVVAGIIECLPNFGHTPGHTVYLIDDVLIWGDMVHAMAVQMPYPTVSVTFDVDNKKAVQARLEMLNYIVDNNFLVAGMHIAYPGIGTLKANGKGGYMFTPIE